MVTQETMKHRRTYLESEGAHRRCGIWDPVEGVKALGCSLLPSAPDTPIGETNVQV